MRYSEWLSSTGAITFEPETTNFLIPSDNISGEIPPSQYLRFKDGQVVWSRKLVMGCFPSEDVDCLRTHYMLIGFWSLHLFAPAGADKSVYRAQTYYHCQHSRRKTSSIH